MASTDKKPTDGMGTAARAKYEPATGAASTDALPGTGATNALAEFVVSSTYATLPDHLVAHLRRLLLDNIGNSAFAASNVESSPPINTAVRRLDDGGGPATVIGDTRTYSYPYAAMLNGAHAHSMDADDTSIQMVGHPGAAVIAAAFAEAERADVRGDAFLEALAVGYEVECRLGEALTVGAYSRGFHVTGVAGIFGAVAALGKLRSYDAHRLECAWGLALSKAAGSMQYLANGSYNKRLHPGFAAHDAFIITALAEAGVIGATSAFEGEYGLLHAYSPSPDPAKLTDSLGTDWLTLRTGIKPYPSCRLTHAAIDAALKLRTQVPDDKRATAKLIVEINAVATQIVGGDEPFKIAPRSIVDAQFSVYFQVAAAWLDGKVDWRSYDKLHDPELLGVTKAMVQKLNADLADGAAIVTVDGVENASLRVDVPSGDPENWMGDAALKHKFMGEAGAVFGTERATEIFDAVLALDVDGSIARLVRMTRLHGGKDA